jgi:hypothetical protein
MMRFEPLAWVQLSDAIENFSTSGLVRLKSRDDGFLGTGGIGVWPALSNCS